MPSFQLTGLDHAQFEPLFKMPDHELVKLCIVRQVATESRGFPCRVSLEDAAAGDDLLLLSFAHQPVGSPYQASGAIFVRRGVRTRVLEPGQIPEYVSRRLTSVRAYDQAHMMIEAEVCEGPLVKDEIQRQLSNENVSYIHLHIARRGCFSCRVNRA